ncbi:MAG: DUF885 domain-containing protein [bacterium]|nr:DUF885 domain-containing protein [bacterium]
MLRSTASAFCLFLTVSFPPAPATAQTPGEETTRELVELFESYFEELLALDPTFATRVGDERYNDRLTIAIDPRYRRDLAALVDKYRTALSRVDPEKLPAKHRLRHALFGYSLDLDREGLQYQDHLLPVAPGYGLPIRFVQMGSGNGIHPFRRVDDYDDFLSRIDDFALWVEVAIRNMREGMKLGIVQPEGLIRQALGELRLQFGIEPERSPFFRPVTEMPGRVPAQQRERLTAAYRRAISETLMPAYEHLYRFLEEEYLPAGRSTISLSELPGGKNRYRYLVRFYTTTEMAPEEIFELGLREIERITREMDRLRQRLKFTGDLAAFRRFLTGDRRFYHTREEDVFEDFAAIRTRVTGALPRLFGRLPAAELEIRRVESWRAATSAGAFYESSAADGSHPGIFYVNIRGAYPKNTMETLFLHEALPGHHFQVALAQEQQDLPRFMRFGYFGAYTEGWGLYCEGLGRELGLYTDPLQYYGRLVYDLGRASRLVADVGIHHKGWSRRQAERYLSERRLGWALHEIDRYVALPGQALAYKVGERKILELRDRAQRALGERFDLRRFHDEILNEGPLPMAILELKIERWIADSAAATKH